MYNRVGVKTPRGTGTSGYVQANWAYRFKVHSKSDFLKDLRRLRENQLQPDYKPDEKILNHNRKRRIYEELEKYKKKLQEKGKSKEDIQKKVKKKEEKFLREFERKGQIVLKEEAEKIKDDHFLALEKEKRNKAMKKAFGLTKKNYKEGTAFDFDEQEKERLERIYQKKLKKVKRLEEKRKRELMEEQREQEQFLLDQMKQEEIEMDEKAKVESSQEKEKKKNKLSKKVKKKKKKEKRKHSK